MTTQYVQPREWQDAFEFISEPSAVAKLGGCDLMPRLRRGTLTAARVVGLGRLPGIRDVEFGAEGARLGAGLTLRALEAEAAVARQWPLLAEVVGLMGSPTIRSMGTAVGNVAQAWPVSDLVPVLEMYGGVLDVASFGSSRRISVEEYTQTPRHGALKNGELISHLLIPVQPEGFRAVYERFSYGSVFEFPLVAIAAGGRMVDGELHDVRVASVGARRMPARLMGVEAALEGQPPGDEGLRQARVALAHDAAPIDDTHASARYRRRVLSVTLDSAVRRLAAIS
jgi:CO/xanthine dehydrogenase FAD-binding subunit